MKLIYGMLIGLVAQLLTFIQLQGRFKYDWMKDNPHIMVLLGIPISYLFMASVNFMVENFDGQIRTSRLI